MKVELYEARRKWRIIKYSAGRWQYLLLLAIAIAFAIVHTIILATTAPSQILLNPVGTPIRAQSLLNWSGRLSASIGGAYLTSVAVDGVFRTKKQSDERKARLIAYKGLTEELRKEKLLIEQLFKAAASSSIDRDEVKNLEELVKSERFEEIRLLDFSGSSNKHDEPTWLHRIRSNHEELEESIDGSLKRYSHVMSPSTIAHLHELSNSRYKRTAKASLDVWDGETPVGLLMGEHNYRDFKLYLNILEQVCEKVGEGFDKSEFNSIYVDESFPETGKDRLKETLSVEEALQEYQENPHKHPY